MINIAVEELCEAANALLAPVRLGVARPTAPFNLSSSNSDPKELTKDLEELFSVEPMAPKPQNSALTTSGRSRSRTRSLTVENLRSAARHQPHNEDSGHDLDEAVSEQPLPPQPQGNIGIQPPQPQDMDTEDSLGAVLEANPNLAGGNDAVEMDPAVGENNDNEDQQSDMDLDYLAESESDSETENEVNDPNNANNPDNGGQGGAGGQNEVFFSDEDTGESSHGEEDESEAGETDEQDGDEFSFGGQVGGPPEELLERRSSGPLGGLGQDRANLAPQSMQWAIRPRTKPRSGGTSSATSNGGMIYIESGQLGRSTSRAHAVAAAAIAAGSGNGGTEAVTMYTTASALARAFSIVVRTISDLLSLLQDYGPLTPPLNRMLDISQSEAVSLQLMIEATLKLNWDWLMTVMDSTEAQLRFGSALTNSTDPNQPGHPLSRSSTGSRMTSSSQEAASTTRTLTSSRYGATLASFSASSGSGTATVQGMKEGCFTMLQKFS